MLDPSSNFSVRLKLFAIYQDVLGQAELDLQVSTGTTVEQVCDRLIEQHPVLARWKSQTRFGVNLDFVSPDTLLHPNDEIVLIPPVSGG